MTTVRDLTFDSDGTTCAAWLYEPEGDDPRPVIVMAHGLGAVRDMGLDAFARRFADAGYLCLVFDYRHFGDSAGEPRQLLSIRRQREDWSRALDFARTLDRSSKVVAWGTSFSGGHVIDVAARKPEVDAVVSQCPFTDGIASVLAIPPLTSLRLTVRALRDALAMLLRRPPVLVPTAGAPGETALMTAPDVLDGYLGLVPAPSTFVDRVAARVVFGILTSRPGRGARRLSMPALFCLCRTDSVAPFKASRRQVAKAPRGVVKEYDAGHFDIYRGADFEQVVADQLAFLSETVPART